MSWDETFRRIDALVHQAIAAKNAPAAPAILRSVKGGPYDYLIVGAGFAGSVLAERLAAGSNKRVLLCDRPAAYWRQCL